MEDMEVIGKQLLEVKMWDDNVDGYVMTSRVS